MGSRTVNPYDGSRTSYGGATSYGGDPELLHGHPAPRRLLRTVSHTDPRHPPMAQATHGALAPRHRRMACQPRHLAQVVGTTPGVTHPARAAPLTHTTRRPPVGRSGRLLRQHSTRQLPVPTLPRLPQPSTRQPPALGRGGWGADAAPTPAAAAPTPAASGGYYGAPTPGAYGAPETPAASGPRYTDDD